MVDMYVHVYAFEWVCTSMCMQGLQRIVTCGIYSSRKCIPVGMGRRGKDENTGMELGDMEQVFCKCLMCQSKHSLLHKRQ